MFLGKKTQRRKEEYICTAIVIVTTHQQGEGSGHFLGFIHMGRIIMRGRLVIVRECSRDMT